MQKNYRTILVAFLIMFFFPAALLLMPAAAEEMQAEETQISDSQFTGEVEIGGRYADSDGDHSFTLPYDTLDSNVILGLDLFYSSPGAGTFDLESSFLDEDDWDVSLTYNKGASFLVEGRLRRIYHALEHLPLPPASATPSIIPTAGPMEIEPGEMNAGAEYYNTFDEGSARFKVRMPSYPAHFTGGARIYRREGPSQMPFYDRSCGTHTCHQNSRTRDLDEETQEYNVGFDGHFGPVDVVYSRNFLLFEDQADDPVDSYGSQPNIAAYRMNRPAGDYVHDVNPDIKSHTDTFKINTNLTNRAVFSASYMRGESKNEGDTPLFQADDLTRVYQRLMTDLGYTLNRTHYLGVSYTYQKSELDNISEAVAATRETIGDSVDPSFERHKGELSYRYTPGSRMHVHSHLSYTDIAREEAPQEGAEELDGLVSGYPDSTGITSLDVDGRFKVSPTLELDAELAGDWTSTPALGTDHTTRYRYGLGATWNPSPTFTLMTRYQGFTGENDDDEALQTSYYKLEVLNEGLTRKDSGNSVMAVATLMPVETLTFSLSYSYVENDIEQDMLFGDLDDAAYNFTSEATPWESIYHYANAEAAWAATKRLKLTLGYMFVTGEETYKPEFAISEFLSEIAAREFVKNMVSLKTEFAFTESTALTLAGTWADYNDKEDDNRDGTAGSVLATISKKW